MKKKIYVLVCNCSDGEDGKSCNQICEAQGGPMGVFSTKEIAEDNLKGALKTSMEVKEALIIY